MGNGTKKATSTKNNATKGKAQAKAKPPAQVTRKAEAQARPTMDTLTAASANLPQIIRPTYKEFDVPSGEEKVIIRKLPVGVRDEITEFATNEDGSMDMGKYAHKACFESLVYPNLNFDQINDIDADDFEVIYHHINELSYRKVGEVVKRFLDTES